jgi:hypothetical protein
VTKTETVISRLAYHTGPTDRLVGVPSFVGMLRPYAGLKEASYDDVMRCLRELSDTLVEKKELRRDLMSSLWGLVWYPKYLALDADSMLRRNRLISRADLATLNQWTRQISHTVQMLLEGQLDNAFNTP